MRRRLAILQWVLSLVLALALWTFVSFTQNPTVDRAVEVPLTVSEIPSGLMVVDEQTGLPDTIDQVLDVLISGPQATIDTLPPGAVQALVDLGDLDAGTHTIPIDVRAPSGVRVREQQPSTLRVRLEPSASATFPITQTVLNQPPFSMLETNAVEVAAAQATVSGPQTLVARVAEVRLPIDVQGRLQSYTASLPLQAVDAYGASVPGVTLSPSSTNVAVRIEPRVDVQQVSVVPQFVGRPADSYVVERFDWTPKSVEVIAPVVITSTLRTEPITLTGRTESFTQTVPLVDVDGIVTRLENNLVTVDVQIQQLVVTSNTPLLIPTVDVENLEPNVRVETPPTGLRVTVSGTYQQFNQLAGTTVRAVVDLQGLGPGTYTLPVEIDLPKGVRVVGEPPFVAITLVANPPPTPTAAPQATPTGGT